MHSDVSDRHGSVLVWWGILLNSTFLRLVYVTFTLIQGKECERARNFCGSYLTKFSIDLDRMWWTVETCLCDEPHTVLISFIQRREPYLCDFVKIKLLTLACIQIFTYHFFSFGMITKSIKLYIWYKFWWPGHSFKATVIWEINSLGVHFFFAVLHSIWIKFSIWIIWAFALLVWIVKAK